jgi:hypothetical protein
MIDNFMTSTINDFSKSLSVILNYKNNSKSLKGGVAFAEEMRDDWDKRKMWKFMTPDLFFSLIAILSWPVDNERQKLIQKILVALDDPVTAAAVENSTTAVAGPIMTLLKDAARLDEISRTTSRFQQSNHNNNKGSQQDNNNRNRYRTQHQQPGTVAAHSAEAATVVNDNNVLAFSVEDQIQHNSGFNEAVPRSQNCWICTKNGSKLPYTAHLSQCSFCFPQKDTKQKSTHSPPCLSTRCSKCDLIGHATTECLQTPTGYRSNINAANKKNNSNKNGGGNKK